jgi:hypothetical protein
LFSCSFSLRAWGDIPLRLASVQGTSIEPDV